MAIEVADAVARQRPDRAGRLEGEGVSPRARFLLGVLSTIAALALVLSATGSGQIDLAVFRTGGANALGSHLYSALVTSRHLPFTYPPFAAILFWPLGHLPVAVGRIIWNVGNVGALLALLALSLKLTQGAHSSRRLWVGAMAWMLPALILNPVRLTTVLGEVNLFLVLMVLADLTGAIGVGAHQLPRGVLLGVAAGTKLTPLIFVPFLFLTRQFRAGITALVSFGVWTLGAFTIAPHSSWLYWTKEIFDTHRVGNPWFVGNQNLTGALERLTGTAPSHALLLGLTLLCASGGLWVAARAYQRSSPLLGLLLCATTGLLVSPISWVDHYVWVVPALAWLAFAEDRPKHGRRWAGLSAVVFILAPMFWLPHYLHHFTGPLQYVEGNAFFLAAVAFVVGTTVMVIRRGPATHDRVAVAASGELVR